MNRAFLLLMSVSVALASPVVAQEPIRIGVYLPLTGNLGYSGQSIWEGIRVAHKMWPQVLDRPVVLRIADTRSGKSEVANAVFRLTEKEKVVALIGERTRVSTGTRSRQAGRRAVPEVSPSAASDAESDQAVVAAKLALHLCDAKTAAIICDIAQEDSIRLAAYFKREFVRAGGRIVSELRVKTGDRDFTAQINQIRKTKPGMIYAPLCYIECGLLARQRRDVGLDTPIIGGDRAHARELVELGGKSVDNLIFTSYFHEDTINTEMGKKYRRICETEISGEPQEGHYRGAEAYLLILDAIRNCGSLNPGEIQEALSCATSFEVMTGTIAISKDERARGRIIVNQVKNGKFVRLPTDERWLPSSNTVVEGQVAP